MVEMTDKQKKVLEYIRMYIWENGYPPTLRELCALTGNKSVGTMSEILNRLERKGVIQRDGGSPRAIRVVK